MKNVCVCICLGGFVPNSMPDGTLLTCAILCCKACNSESTVRIINSTACERVTTPYYASLLLHQCHGRNDRYSQNVRQPTGKQARDSIARLCKLNKKKNGKKRSTKKLEKQAASSNENVPVLSSALYVVHKHRKQV